MGLPSCLLCPQIHPGASLVSWRGPSRASRQGWRASSLNGCDEGMLLDRTGLRSRPAQSPSNPLSPGSWQDYYTWRGLSLDSPMAVLLTYPLTVYYVITHLVPQSCKESRAGGDVLGT